MNPFMEAFQHLPLYRSLDLITSELDQHQNLLLTSPTGSGKSIFIPFLAYKKTTGRVVVLEPRKIAAQSLAEYLASLLKEPCGETVGYQFHLENCKSKDTRILFQTYGSFLQELLHREPSVDTVIFDEFHERRADMDLLMSYFKKKQEQNKGKGPRIIVLSAKLAKLEMEQLLKTRCLELDTASFPVQILHQKKQTEVVQALRTLQRNNFWQTTLVFLPGRYEIKRTRQLIEEAFGYQSLSVIELFSGQGKEELQRLFTPTKNPRVVLTTNVAETSLTVPNVTAVIDSGLERISEYEESKDITTLRLSRITLQNAIQRTGRAGRTQEGVCIRLWEQAEEEFFCPEIIPEVQRTSLLEIVLQHAFLAEHLGISPFELGWVSPPKESTYKSTLSALEALHFLKDDYITPLGKKALQVPLLSVTLSAFVLSTTKLSDSTLVAIAWIDSGTAFLQRQRKAFNLEELAMENSASMPKEVRFTYNRLQEYCEKENKKDANNERGKTALLFLKFFSSELSIANGSAYKTKNNSLIQIDEATKKEVNALIPFAVWRTENQRKSELRASLYYPIPEYLLHDDSDQIEYEVQWRNKQTRFIGIEVRLKNDIEISRKEIIPQEASSEVLTKLKEIIATAWLKKMERESLSHLFENEETLKWLVKMKLAAKYFPEYEFPKWNQEDLTLVKEELVQGVFLQRDINPERYLKILKEYFGESMIPWLIKTFPDHYQLSNGKRGKYTYLSEELVEIAARLGDFIGMQGKHTIAEGRIAVRYDILAPNYRTVQKTWDLSGFWEKTYPEIRKELRGRYPRHPWPEKI